MKKNKIWSVQVMSSYPHRSPQLFRTGVPQRILQHQAIQSLVTVRAADKAPSHRQRAKCSGAAYNRSTPCPPRSKEPESCVPCRRLCCCCELQPSSWCSSHERTRLLCGLRVWLRRGNEARRWGRKILLTLGR